MNENYSTQSYYETFQSTAKKLPDKAALKFLGAKASYSQLLEQAESMAANLWDIGLRKDDRAIIYLPNGPQWIISWLALLRLNAVPVPITPIYTPSDLKFIINDSGAETIIGMDTNFGYIKRVFPETPLKRIIVTTLMELMPWGKRLFCRAFSRVPKGKFRLGENIFKFGSLSQKKKVSLPPYKADARELIGLLYTGGTTGLPKGVPISNDLFVHRTMVIRNERKSLIPIGEDVILQGVPLFHVFGMLLGGGSLIAGDLLILYPRVNMDAIFDHIQHHRVRTVMGVPSFYRMILDHDRVDFYDLGSLEYSFSAGDVLPIEIQERWQGKFGKTLFQGYGATETGAAVSMAPVGEEHPTGSAGKIMPFQKFKLIDPDTLMPVPPGQPGEMLVSSENMVTSYWNNQEETARCFVEMDGALWYRTGDIIKIDDEGWLFFQDRTSDMIKHKGYRIAASEIEVALQEHPAVIASCVVGIPDEKVGERIKAFVVFKEDIRGVTAYDLMKWCRRRLASYKVPQYIEFRDMLPKSKVGKMLRREMRNEELRKLQ
ncbi:MAG: class I adenylate-forming enzyme family protein [Thermodesulfobacteriota bacterium]|nr:class I adenylate-forming enzyme family protein [Thermodesulfobacteriota bacterium]